MKAVIGSEEWCRFPGLDLPAIKARVDSGAKTSSIHAFNIHTFRRQGNQWVSFEVHPIQNDRRTVIRCEQPIVDRRAVKSSSGVSETRYVISTQIELGDDSWEVELTLANRDSMGYRMLLGREAMSGRVLIDPSQSFCAGKLSQNDLTALYTPTQTRRSGLKMALLASNPKLYSNRRLLEAGEERGHEMVFLNIEQCYLKLDSNQPEVHYRGGKVISDIDVVIPRIRQSMSYYGCALARQFESMKIASVNAAEAIGKSHDQLYVLQLLIKAGLTIPTTGYAHSARETDDLIEMVEGAPLLVKILQGGRDSEAVLSETQAAAESVINAMQSLDAQLLVQQHIKTTDGKQIRCLVIDGKVVAAIQRPLATGKSRGKIHQDSAAALIRISPEERKLAVDASKLLGLSIAGIDLIRAKYGPVILQVHASAGIESLETASGKDIAGMMIASIEKKLRWKRELG